MRSEKELVQVIRARSRLLSRGIRPFSVFTSIRAINSVRHGPEDLEIPSIDLPNFYFLGAHVDFASTNNACLISMCAFTCVFDAYIAL